jgi:hypothetical protein
VCGRWVRRRCRRLAPLLAFALLGGNGGHAPIGEYMLALVGVGAVQWLALNAYREPLIQTPSRDHARQSEAVYDAAIGAYYVKFLLDARTRKRAAHWPGVVGASGSCSGTRSAALRALPSRSAANSSVKCPADAGPSHHAGPLVRTLGQPATSSLNDCARNAEALQRRLCSSAQACRRTAVTYGRHHKHDVGQQDGATQQFCRESDILKY